MRVLRARAGFLDARQTVYNGNDHDGREADSRTTMTRKHDKPRLAKPNDPCEPRKPASRAAWAVCGLLAVAVWLVFGQTLHHEFVNYDDPLYVTETPLVTGGLSLQAVQWAFSTTRAGNWHPLTWLSLMLDGQLYGRQPWGYHLTNLLLHAATAILLFLVLRRMTGDLWPAALAAAVFAIHPLRAESVAWVAERKDVLSGLFFMLTLAAYLGYVRRPFSVARYLLVVAALAAGLLAKPAVVTLPLVLLLLDYWPLGRCGAGVSPASLVPTLCVGTQFLDAPTSHEILNQGSALDNGTPKHPGRAFPRGAWERGHQGSALDNGTPKHPGRAFPRGAWERGQYGRLVVEKIPLFLLAAASCVATPLAQGQSVVALEIIPLPLRISNAMVSYVSYVGQFFHPVDLAVFYPHPGPSLSWWETAAAFLILIGVSAGAIALRRRRPCLLVGWFWYLGMLVPMIGLVQVGTQAQADRYTYLPQIGLCIALIWGMAPTVASWPHRRSICWGAAMFAAAVLMSIASRQTAFWRDSETLWKHALDCTSKNARAHNNFGNVMMDKGQVERAIEHYEEALKIVPRYAEAHNNLAAALMNRGQVDQALEHFQKALEQLPDMPQAHQGLGNIYSSRGQFDRVVEHYRRVLKLNPEDANVRYNLGVVLNRQGKTAEAVREWRKVIRLQPGDADALDQLAWALATSPERSIRNGAEAVLLARRAVQQTDGRDADILATLAAAQAEAGQFSDAIASVERAISLASAAGKTEAADAFRTQLRLYRAGSPYREGHDQPAK